MRRSSAYRRCSSLRWIRAHPQRRRNGPVGDVVSRSIESYNAGDFDRLRSLLADDFYEEELATQRRLEGADARIEAAQSWKRALSGRARHDNRGVRERNTVAIELTWEGHTVARWRRPMVRSCRRRTNA